MSKCWCGSGLEYNICHKDFDKKIKKAKKQGYMIPPKKIIKNAEKIEKMKKAAVVNNGMLDYIEEHIKAGMSTEDIDDMCVKYLKEHGGRSADLGYQGYPKSVCTSVNDVVCHGVPSKEVILKEGDIVNVDATTEVNGYYADASRMFMIGKVNDNAKRLVEVTKECLEVGMAAVKPWESTVNDIGKAIEKHAHANGYSVVEEFCGHGIGKSMHEDPYVFHYDADERSYLLVPGMCFTIEPMINEGARQIFIDSKDNWTVYTEDRKLSAQWEHTLVVTEEGVEIISK